MLTHHLPEAAEPARVVVLGANGFVGQRLVASLQADGVSAVPLARRDVDLTSSSAASALAERLQPNDAIVILAALTPDRGRGPDAFQSNIAIGIAVTRALEKAPVAHVLNFSSDAVYPFGDGLTNESSPAQPTDLYGAAHLTRELMISGATRAPVATFRLPVIYGAGDTHNSYGPNRFIRTARGDRKIALFGNGEETRDHVFIDDVVRLTRLTLRHRSAGILNIASGCSIAFADLARKVGALSQVPVRVEPSPRQNPITHRHFDVAAIRHAFPQFVPTSIDAGLARAWRDWPGGETR